KFKELVAVLGGTLCIWISSDHILWCKW
ncbi:hypothetical protein SNEBB_001412, partial [Seison nebaliae]